MFNSCSSGFLTSDFCWRGSNLSNKAPSLGLLFSTIAALSVACFLIVGSKTALGASCGSLITACGCTVDSPGLHTVGADLVASQGLTASGSCIDISAGGATLDLKNFSADGNGSGIGINILSGANNVVVVQSGRGIISDWGVGIEAADDRPDILFVDVESSVNSGIFLNGTTNANLWDLSSDNNGEAGVRISNGFGNHVFSSGFDRNKIGVWIDSSQRSRLDDSGYTSNTTGVLISGPSHNNHVLSCAASTNLRDGIRIAAGSTMNIVGECNMSGNATTPGTFFDARDNNAGCDSNTWFDNKIGTANRLCIH